MENQKQTLAMEGTINSKYIDWAEIVYHLTDIKYLDLKKVERWSSIFHGVRILTPEKGNQMDIPNVRWSVYNPDVTRTELWNRNLMTAQKEWVLFLEDDEEMVFMDFPEKDHLGKDRWAPSLITVEHGDKIHQYYQIRLVHSKNGSVFTGQDLPDCTRFIVENDIKLSHMPVLIERISDFTRSVDLMKEQSIAEYAPQVHLIEGRRLFKAGKYLNAASYYRQILKKERLLPFDRLAAVNGLASCFTEQFKWQNALNLTETSLEAESLQNTPYLIQYKIHQLQQQWEEAYQALNRYHENQNLHSKASFDVIVNTEDTLLSLTDLAMKLGDKTKAIEHLRELYQLKNGDIEEGLLKKLLLLCVEQKDENGSILYFKRMFEDVYPEKLLEDEKRKAEFNDFMTMFMSNGWYEFVHKIYSKLLEVYPHEDEYKRRLIVVSVKTNRMDEARRLASKVA